MRFVGFEPNFWFIELRISTHYSWTVSGFRSVFQPFLNLLTYYSKAEDKSEWYLSLENLLFELSKNQRFSNLWEIQRFLRERKL